MILQRFLCLVLYDGLKNVILTTSILLLDANFLSGVGDFGDNLDVDGFFLSTPHFSNILSRVD